MWNLRGKGGREGKTGGSGCSRNWKEGTSFFSSWLGSWNHPLWKHDWEVREGSITSQRKAFWVHCCRIDAGGCFVLGSVSGVWTHSEARLEAPGFIPAQWAAAAALVGPAGGFKPLLRWHNSMQLTEKMRAGKQNHTLIIRVYRKLQHWGWMERKGSGIKTERTKSQNDRKRLRAECQERVKEVKKGGMWEGCQWKG